MSKTFKLSLIFLVTVVNLVVFRMIFTVINLPDNLANWLFSGIFQIFCMGVIPYLMYRWIIGKDFKRYMHDFHLEKRIHPVSYVLAVVIGLLVFILNNAFSSVWYVFLNSIGYTYVSSVGTIYSSPEVLALEIITTAMLPAVFEELTDRGLLLAVLDESGIKDLWKVLIVGVFFGFLHQNITQLLPAIFGGVVMAVMAVKCRSIYPTMIVHFLNNFIITMYDYSDQKGGGFAEAYDSIYTSCTSSYLAYFGVILFAVLLLFLVLKIFATINEKHQKTNSTPIAPKAVPIEGAEKTEEQEPAVYSCAKDEFLNGVVIPRLDKEYLEKNESAVKSSLDVGWSKPKKNSANWWEFGLMLTAGILAVAVTIFTLWWGILR